MNSCPSILEKVSFSKEEELNFVVDTRKIIADSAFVAIPGARVNPLTLLEKNFDSRLKLVIYQDGEENNLIVASIKKSHPNIKFIKVNDSVTFLQELTSLHIRQWQENPAKVLFAISGSNGKTTHKEMLSHILNGIIPGKVISTEKNNNNHLGVPLTLLNVNKDTEFVVLELGSNHPGEIKVLCDIAHPNSGLTTNIGATHLEFFGSEKEVFVEEGYLYHSVKENTLGSGFYLINLDDPFLKTFAKTKGSLTYGETDSADIKISFTENGAEAAWSNENLKVRNDFITGKHNKLNLITCALVAYKFYPKLREQILKTASEFRPTKNRSEWIEYKSKPIFLDAYNANPSSMKAAILAFKESFLERGFLAEEACLVLGDMNELGENAPRYHKEIGTFLNNEGFKNVTFVGRYADNYLEGFPQGSKKATVQEFKEEFIRDCLPKFSIHFIKGSRSLQLESLFDIT